MMGMASLPIESAWPTSPHICNVLAGVYYIQSSSYTIGGLSCPRAFSSCTEPNLTQEAILLWSHAQLALLSTLYRIYRALPRFRSVHSLIHV